MREETIKIYKFDELSDESKEVARNWWRECENQDSSFSEVVYEDAAIIAELFGLDIRQKVVKCVDKSIRYDTSIYYSGFSSQGDGACFEGAYQYKKGSVKAVKEHAPLDTELHEIVQALCDIQKINFYQLYAQCNHSGHYYHSGCMQVDVERQDNWHMTETAEEDVRDILRLFADWIYSRLENEFNFTMSDENIDESIECNEYEFTENGNIH